jgi:hypothetical protein
VDRIQVAAIEQPQWVARRAAQVGAMRAREEAPREQARRLSIIGTLPSIDDLLPE